MNTDVRKNPGKTSAGPNSTGSSSNNNSDNSENNRQNIRRAVRHLRRSGRRLVRREDGWAVTHSGRLVARLNTEEVAFLLAEGHVVEAQGGGLVIASGTTDEATSAPDVPVTGEWVFVAAGCPIAARAPGRGFEKLAHKARAGEGPLSLRQAEAGLRFIADAETAARRPGLTMDWTNTVTDRQRRHGRDGGLSFNSRAAARRLDWILKVIGGGEFALVWRACVERRPITKLAADLDVGPPIAARQLSVALESVAEVYDASG